MDESPGPTILVVEDDDQVRGLIRTLLMHDGYHVIEAVTGAEAVDAARQYDRPIDLLLCDMLLPELSGFDVAETLRSLNPSMKILFISGYVEGEIVQRSTMELGASFLDKPFQPAALLERVRDAVGPARSSTSAA